MMSQLATSNAASADWEISSGRPYSACRMFHASRSTSNGSLPMTYLGASSSIHATSVLVLFTIRISPTPVRPESVMSSTNASSRHGAPTIVTRTSVIFIGASLHRPVQHVIGGPVVPFVDSYPCRCAVTQPLSWSSLTASRWPGGWSCQPSRHRPRTGAAECANGDELASAGRDVFDLLEARGRAAPARGAGRRFHDRKRRE